MEQTARHQETATICPNDPATETNTKRGTIMKKAICAILFLCTFIPTVCLADSYKKYIGLWEGEERDHLWGGTFTVVAEIRKDGDTYLISGDILRGKRPDVLSKKNGQLVLDFGFGSIPLGLGEGNNTLFFDKKQYKRITRQRVTEIQEQMRRDEEEAAARRKIEEEKREAERAEAQARMKVEEERRQAELAKEREERKKRKEQFQVDRERCKQVASDLKARRNVELKELHKRKNIQSKERQEVRKTIINKYKEAYKQEQCKKFSFM